MAHGFTFKMPYISRITFPKGALRTVGSKASFKIVPPHHHATGHVGQRLLMNDLDTFYLNATEPNRSCLLAVRTMVLAQDPLVTETRKYGMPCFCYRKKMFCYLWVDKRTHEPYLLFVEGKHLDHPALERGDRARMKILRVDPNADIPVDTVEELLTCALDLYRNGTIVIK